MYKKGFVEYLVSEKRYSKHSVVAYQKDLNQFFKFLNDSFEVVNPAEVSNQMIRSWIVELMNHNLSSRTIKRKLSAIKTLYRYLRKSSIVTFNPATAVVPPKSNKRLPEFVTPEQMDLLLDQELFDPGFKGLRDRLVIEILYQSGMRLSELTGLKEQDIDFNYSQIKVLGKRNKERLIPFNNILQSSLKEYLAAKRTEFANELTGEYLIVTDKGEKAYNKMVYRIVNSYLSKVSTLKKKSPHILRHSFATHLLNNGADLNAIKEILGHANLAATQIYTHNSIEKLKKVYNQAHPRA